MDESAFDQATRAFGSTSRRGILRSLAATAIGTASTLMLSRQSRAGYNARARLGNYGAEVSIENGNSKKKRKEKRCKKDANSCRVDVAGFCGTFWIDYSSCVASLGSCCSYVKNCKYGTAGSCIENNPYYFLA